MYIFRVKIIVFLDFVAEIVCTVNVTLMEVGTLAKIPCDYVSNDHEIRLVQWYKSRNTDVFQNGEDSLAWWENGKTGSVPNYKIENDTHSLVILNTTLQDEGLYKCLVARGDLFKESNYYIRAVTYVLPGTGLVMTVEDDLDRVHCAVDHVKPLIFPVLDFQFDEANAVLNEDGTYSTSVCCQLPHGRNRSNVNCSFSYLHHHQVETLSLPHTTTDKPTRVITTMSNKATSVTFADGGCRTNERTLIIVVLTICIILSIAVNAILVRKPEMILGKCKSNKVKENEEEVMDTMVVV